MNPTPFPPPAPKPPPLGDPLLDERLARLAARRPGAAEQQPGARPAAAPSKRSSRPHAARGSRAAALALSVTTTIGLAGYLRQESVADSTTISASASTSAATVASPATTSAVATTAATQAGAAAPAETAATTAVAAAATTATTVAAAAVDVADASATSTGLADGTYAGATETNRWGDVQVQITVSGGVITDVSVPVYPDGENKSVQINQRALPTLIQATLSAQSADVDTVSGATYTSESYRESLQSAIDAARAAVAA